MSINKFRKNSLPRQGYVLVTTVLVMALISLLMVGIANHSMKLATSAVLEEEALQSRWASISVQHSILRNAEQILNYPRFREEIERFRSEDAETEDSANESEKSDIDWQLNFPTQLTFQLELNGRPYQFLLSDENCKINLEKLRQQNTASEASAVLNDLLKGNLNLQRQQDFGTSDWKSWGQLFRPNGGQILMRGIEQATTEVTLWSNGQVNYLRCTDDVFRASLEAVLLKNEARKVVEARQEHPTWKLRNLLTAAAIADEKQQRVYNWILSDERSLGSSNEPNTFSLWVRNDSAKKLQFHIMATTARPQHLSFEW